VKYIVKVRDTSYEVEVGDIHARPIIARVDGQIFEVTPENGIKPTPQQEAKELQSVEFLKQSVRSSVSSNELTAPLPGTVIEIFVKAGEQIESGQVMLVIEAMKMKNSIRSTRAGKLADVLVSAGETVAHKQVLVKFE
jgi:glutaconyl-CoA/methylmalonyl-CoA decarboxylase subunit gamma